MSLVAEELKSSLKENDNQLLAIIDKTGEWVDKHPKEANQILTYLEQKIKSQRGGGQRGGSQRGGNVHYGPDGVDMNEMSLPLILVMAMEEQSSSHFLEIFTPEVKTLFVASKEIR